MLHPDIAPHICLAAIETGVVAIIDEVFKTPAAASAFAALLNFVDRDFIFSTYKNVVA